MAATLDVSGQAAPTGGANTAGTLESTAQLKLYKFTVKDDSNTAVDLRTVDGAYGSTYDLILREFSPMLAFAVADASGVIHMVMDGHHNDAASLQTRLRQVASASPSANDSTVEIGVSFTVTP